MNTNAKQNPYVGPRTFTRAERGRFFGREREARDLLSLVISERLVLFYAQSGAGKSSLINTRLGPQLQETNFAVLPVGRVSGALPQGVNTVDNIFVFNLLLSLDQGEGDPTRFAQMSLTDFLARLTTPDGEHYYYDEAAEVTSEVDEREQPPHVLIIDQFEEIVTTHLANWQEREGFFRQLDQAMAHDPLLWVVLTLREDYVAALDPYAHLLSGKLRTRFYMQRMDYEAALEAVKKPAEQAGRPFASDVAEILVDNLRQIRVHGQQETYPGQFVEPVQLQVVCYQLWENLKGRPLAEITAQDLQELGNVDATLAQFYEQAIAKVVRQTKESERHVRSWFDHQLITESDTRGIVHQGSKRTGGLNNETVKLLADQFLLRGEIRAGGVWYELTHDRFVGPIRQSNADWRSAMFKKWGTIGGGIAVVLVILIVFVIGAFIRQQAKAQVAVVAEQAAVVEATSTAVALRERARPLRTGLSISGEETQAGTGTLGYFVQDEEGQVYILSVTDVLGETDDEEGAGVVLQPGALDGGNVPEDVVGRMIPTFPLTNPMPAAHLAALARLEPGVEIETIIPELNLPVQDVHEPEIGMTVHKFGRTTGWTTGTIKAINEDVVINFSDGTVELQNSIRVSMESEEGDGGALIVDTEGYAIGILIAGSSEDALLAPIQDVLDSFEVKLVRPASEEVQPESLEPAVYGENAYIYGIYDRGGQDWLMVDGQAKGWIVINEVIGTEGEDTEGSDYTDLADQGLGVIVVLVENDGPGGSLPPPDQCSEFARRAEDFVQNSSGAHIWVIGNAMNAHQDEPPPPAPNQQVPIPPEKEREPITPRHYADCYSEVREDIQALLGHQTDQVVVGAIAPWESSPRYEADPEGQYSANSSGDWVQYLSDILLAIGPKNADGIAIHAYTHGANPNLVFSEERARPPFEQYHFQFRVYRDQMAAIPPEFRHLPVYLTEMNQGDPWADVSSGWIQNVYKEINEWNNLGNQQIRTAVLYRWSEGRWHIGDKANLAEDLRKAMAKNYRWYATPPPSPTPTPIGAPNPTPTYE